MLEGLVARVRDAARASPGEAALIALLGAVVAAASIYVLVETRTTDPPPIRKIAARTSPSPGPATLLVHVAGSVNSPGIYHLNEAARVIDAVTAAGGPTPDADVHALNLAAAVSDGEKVVVPSKQAQAPGAEPAPAASPSKVNLNIATKEQLESLPGVGPVLAQRIIDYRTRKGKFTSVRQLLEVDGVGQKKFDGLKNLVSVT